MEVGLKNILYHFIEVQAHFGMPRGAKTSLIFNKPNWVALHPNPNTTSEHAPQLKRNYWFGMVCKNKQ